jgi:hypothetical protein
MAEQTAGFEQFERDLENFRLVLKSLTRIGNHGEALRLAAALTPFWMARGQMLVSGWRTRGRSRPTSLFLITARSPPGRVADAARDGATANYPRRAGRSRASSGRDRHSSTLPNGRNYTRSGAGLRPAYRVPPLVCRSSRCSSCIIHCTVSPRWSGSNMNTTAALCHEVSSCRRAGQHTHAIPIRM